MKKTKLIIFDGQSEQRIATLSNKGKQCPFYSTEVLEQLNGDFTFEFSIPANHNDSKYVKRNNLVGFYDLDGNLQVFQIYKTEEEHIGLELRKKIYTEHIYYELADDVVSDLRVINGPASESITKGLSQSRWNAGVVSDLGLKNVNFYYSSGLENIQKSANTYGGELGYRLTEDGKRITGRFVDLLVRRGSDTGKRFEYNKDLISVVRTEQIDGIKTALFGRGSGEEIEDTGGYTRKVTFKDVVWSVANGDPVNKPAGQEWVGLPSALIKWGRLGGTRHRVGTFDVESTDPEEILELTFQELQRVSVPRVTYELTAITLEELTGLDHHKVRLGDTVFVIDRDLDITIEARVIEIKRDLVNPENTEITLGNFIDDILDYNKQLEEVKAKLTDRQGVWDKADEEVTIDDSDILAVTPYPPANVSVEALFKSIALTWSFDPSIKIAGYEVYGSRVSNFTPDESNLLFRGKSGGYLHNANTNETWYFRIRTLNAHGTPSAFTQQFEASTLRIQDFDIEEKYKADIVEEVNTYSDEIRDALLLELVEKAGLEYVDGQLQQKADATTVNQQFQQITNDLMDKANVEYVDGQLQLKSDETSVQQRFQEVTNDLLSKAELEYVDGQLQLKADSSLVTSITGRVNDLEEDVATKVDGDWVDGRLLSKADKDNTYTKTEVDSAVNSRVSKTDYTIDKDGFITRFEANESRITQTETEIASKVSKTEFEELEGDVGGMGTRLSNAETTITQHADQIQSKASQTDVNSLIGRVSNAETTITQQAELIESKASATDLNTLTGRVSTAESNITQQAGQIASKVEQTDFNVVEQRVSSAESSITQQAGMIEQRVTNTEFTTGLATKENSIFKQTTAPSHLNGRFWLDTSKTPNVLMRSTGSAWVKATPTEASEVGAYSTTQGNALAGRVSTTESSITQLSNEIQSKVSQTDFDGVAGRLSTAESTITQHANQIASKVSQTDFNQAEQRLSNAESTIIQQADQISQRVTQTTFTNELATKENNVLKQNTAPAHLNGRLWLDTSKTPNVLMRSTGSAWVKVTPTEASEVGAYSTTQGDALAGRVSTAESTITQHAGEIQQRVTNTEFTSGLSGKENSVFKQTTAPAHSNGRLWLDTSKTPNVLMRSTGSAWVKVTPTTASEVGAYSSTEGTTLAGRVSTAESTITQHANQIASKVNTTDYTTDKNGFVTRFESNESLIQQNANAITQRVTLSQFNDLEIGGRNLLENSTFNNGTTAWSFSASRISVLPPESDKPFSSILRNLYSGTNLTATGYNTKRTLIKAGESRKVTLSFDFKTSDIENFGTSSIFTIRRSTASTGGTITSIVGGGGLPTSVRVAANNGKWVRVTHTVDLPVLQEDWWLIAGGYHAGTSFDYLTREWKLEFGEKATDWTPAPEDVENRLTNAETSISQNATAINLRATKTELNTEKQRIDNAFSELSVQATQISQRVEKNGVISSINQTSESIKIQAQKIELSGDVTIVNGLTRIGGAVITDAMIKNGVIKNVHIEDATITSGKIASLVADKITTGTLNGTNVNITNLNASNITSGIINAARVSIGANSTFASGYNPSTILFTGQNIVEGSLLDTAVRAGGGAEHPTITKDADGFNVVRTVSNGSASNFGFTPNSSQRRVDIEQNKTYTISFEIRGNVGYMSYVYLMRSDGANSSFPSLLGFPISTTGWTKVHSSLTAPWTTNQGYFLIGTQDSASGKWFEVRKVKLEEGTKATTWTPNPKEVQGNVEVTQGQLDSWKWGNTTEIDGGKIRTNTVTANQINVQTLSALSADLGNVTAGNISGVNINGSTTTVSGALNLTQTDISSGIFLSPGWIIGGNPRYKTVIGVNSVVNGGLTSETHALELNPNADRTTTNGKVSIYGELEVWDKSNSTYMLRVAPNQVRLGSVGEVNVNASGGDARWRRDLSNNHMIMQTLSSIHFVQDGEYHATFSLKDGTTRNSFLGLGGMGIKALRSGGMIQIRDSADTSWGTLRAGKLEYQEIGQFSSHTLKRDIIPVKYSTLDIINQLKFYDFRYKDESDDAKKHFGTIVELTPEPLVGNSGDSVSISNLVFMSAKAIQELDEKIERLESIINELMGSSVE